VELPDEPVKVAAVVLAAGSSKRMGEPKLVLPWGNTTVIGQVVSTLIHAGVRETVVVLGGAYHEVFDALVGFNVRTVYNPCFEKEELIYSLQVGLSTVSKDIDAILIALGDHPQIQCQVVSDLLRFFADQNAEIVVPSFQMRQGHPWLVSRSLWSQLMDLRPPETLRDFLKNYHQKIHYMNVESDSILLDLDTPSDYREQRP